MIALVEVSNPVWSFSPSIAVITGANSVFTAFEVRETDIRLRRYAGINEDLPRIRAQ